MYKRLGEVRALIPTKVNIMAHNHLPTLNASNGHQCNLPRSNFNDLEMAALSMLK